LWLVDDARPNHFKVLMCNLFKKATFDECKACIEEVFAEWLPGYSGVSNKSTNKQAKAIDFISTTRYGEKVIRSWFSFLIG
jgi:hypothetical protein